MKDKTSILTQEKAGLLAGYEEIISLIDTTINSNYEYYSKEELIEKIYETSTEKVEGRI